LKSPRRILVATDFSELARVAEDTAMSLAREFGAELHWIHALEVVLPMFEPYALVLPDVTLGESRRVAREKLDAAKQRAAEVGLQGTVQLGHAPAAQAIAARAQEIEADLVVIGTHGHSGFTRFMLGSVAERTVQFAPCSVLTVKGERALERPESVLVAVDFSETSRETLGLAAALAEMGARVHLAHALEVPVATVMAYQVHLPDRLVQDARREAEKLLGQWAALVPGSSFSVLEGPPHVALPDLAEKLSADLILTGSRGLTRAAHLVLGSVAERTLRASPCSVWTVRPPEPAAD